MSALFVTNPTDDIQAIETSRDRLLKGSGSWLFRHPTLTQWLNEDKSSVLWVHGKPGKGKTMLAISLVADLSSKIETAGSCNEDTLAFFFCSYEDTRRKDPVAIL